MQRRRAALASWLALAVAVSGVAVYAVQADGYQAHEAELNDGGIWVTNNRDGFYGRINKPIGQLDGTVFARLDSNLDIVQDGASVVGVNLSDGVVVPDRPRPDEGARRRGGTDPRQPGSRDGRRQPRRAGPATGELWAAREDPATRCPGRRDLADQADPSPPPGGRRPGRDPGRRGLRRSAAEDSLVTGPPAGRTGNAGFETPHDPGAPGRRVQRRRSR